MQLARLAAAVFVLAAPALAAADAPRYVITDLGTVGGNLYSQGFGMSASGNAVVGRSLAADGVVNPWPALIWREGVGTQELANLAGRDYAAGYGVNDSGIAVGVAAVTGSGADPRPVIWSTKNGVSQLNLPAGQTLGRAFDINNKGIAVGSVNSGTAERGAIYNTVTGSSTVINAFSAAGSFMQTAYAINDAGIVVGAGVDMSSRNIIVSYNTSTGVLSEVPVPAYTLGFNSSLAFNISENGYIVGGSGNSSQAILYSPFTNTTIAVPLPSMSSNGSLRSVNDQGWAVGNSGGQYSNPFLYADGTSYLISDLITNGAGWNFTTTTSASARGIGNNGAIIGTAQFNGVEHAYMMTLAPVPEPATYALMLAGLACVGFMARARKAA